MSEQAPDPARPLVSILLIAYNQRDLVGQAVTSALAQTYSPLEILISDDASSDGTFEAIKTAVSGYAGPHRIVLNRNDENIGIGAHLCRLAAMSKGELLFVAAGDDISLPQRCATVVEAWERAGRKPDLISGELIDMDYQGRDGDIIRPDDLGAWRSFADWARKSPSVIGASHTWSRRLFERFGPIRPHIHEDLVMSFRAILSGGAISLRQPLVRYRRGGLTRGKRPRTPQVFIAQVLRSNRTSLAEIAQLLDDAAVAGVTAEMQRVLARRQAREFYLRDLFTAPGLWGRLKLLFRRGGADPAFRLRYFLYAACPWVYAPFFFLKGLLRR
jgi:glycosyltransferase involved in cell wall biosynthesis